MVEPVPCPAAKLVVFEGALCLAAVQDRVFCACVCALALACFRGRTLCCARGCLRLGGRGLFS